MKKRYTISVPVEYVFGNLRNGHLEMIIEADNEEEARAEFDPRYADLIVDDWEVYEYGDPMMEDMEVLCVESN